MTPLLAAALLVASLTGRYEAPGATLELHIGHDAVLRGILIDGSRIAALNPVQLHGEQLTATALFDDESRAELTGSVARERIRLSGRTFRRVAVERPATATVRREIFAAYERLAEAVNTKNYDAFQALRIPEFATIPSEGPPRNAAWMAQRAAGLLAAIQPPIQTRNDILSLTVRGNEAIATVRQRFYRNQPNAAGVVRRLETEVTQRETWIRTRDGWKLSFVDEVRDQVRREPRSAPTP